LGALGFLKADKAHPALADRGGRGADHRKPEEALPAGGHLWDVHATLAC